MRRFEIVTDRGRRQRCVATLVYDQDASSAEIDIAPDARVGQVPAMFNRYIELGNLHIAQEWTLRWVKERVAPETRHNIGEVLREAGLSEYDPYLLLFAHNGRSVQDDFYLREVSCDSADERGQRGGAAPGQRYEYDLVSIQGGIGRQIADARRRQGVTQQELAFRTGIQQATISRLERGLGNPTVETLTCIAHALGLQLEIGFRQLF